MAIIYPDIIGEYLLADQRYETSGLQYMGIFSPPDIKFGETTHFYLYLQSTVDVTVTAEIKLNLPQSGRFRGQPVLRTKEVVFTLELATAEVGRVAVPLTTTDKKVDGKYTLEVEIKATHDKQTNKIRKSRDKPATITYLDNLVGLDLVGTLGNVYRTKNAKKAGFDLNILKEEGEPTESPKLDWSYQQVWTIEMAELMHKARAEVNEARIKILEDLQVEPLFTALYAESTERFADAGLPLRIGEAIALGKLLTYTAHTFLAKGPLQDGLLYPIWERAIANDMSTANTCDVIKFAGYKHILRLATAISFGMVAENIGHHAWSQQERQEVTNFIATALDEGMTLPADFLYLPLMMGALNIVGKVRLPNEDLNHTLNLIRKARIERPDILSDEDMAQANQIYNQMLEQSLATAKS